MARYFLGHKFEGKYQPLDLEFEKTSILDVIEYTASFFDEIELKEFLLNNKLIENYTDELFYLKEEGKKDNRKYKVIRFGENIVYGSDKMYFNVDYIRNYISNNKYNLDFLDRLMLHYMNKYNVIPLIQNRIKSLFANRGLLVDFLDTLNEITDEFIGVKERLLSLYDSNELFKLKSELEKLSEQTTLSRDNILSLYRYFRKQLDLPYGITLNYLNQLFSLTSAANRAGIDEYESNYQNKRALEVVIENLLTSIVYKYDSKNKCYKLENNKFVVYQRNLVDIGLFIMLYEEKRFKAIQNEKYVYSDEQEEFLEEEDFTRINTTSEREGIKLVLHDDQKK